MSDYVVFNQIIMKFRVRNFGCASLYMNRSWINYEIRLVDLISIKRRNCRPIIFMEINSSLICLGGSKWKSLTSSRDHKRSSTCLISTRLFPFYSIWFDWKKYLLILFSETRNRTQNYYLFTTTLKLLFALLKHP